MLSCLRRSEYRLAHAKTLLSYSLKAEGGIPRFSAFRIPRSILVLDVYGNLHDFFCDSPRPQCSNRWNRTITLSLTSFVESFNRVTTMSINSPLVRHRIFSCDVKGSGWMLDREIKQRMQFQLECRIGDTIAARQEHHPAWTRVLCMFLWYYLA